MFNVYAKLFYRPLNKLHIEPIIYYNPTLNNQYEDNIRKTFKYSI